MGLKTDFTLDPIRSDRFAELVRKVGLPQLRTTSSSRAYLIGAFRQLL
jgi:hypothetical protein